MHDLSTAAEARLSERAERDAEAGGMGKTGEGGEQVAWGRQGKEEHDLRGLRGGIQWWP